jgi:hypothetical protein
MKILFVTSIDPDRAVGGGATATRSLIETLQTNPINASVDVTCITQQASRLPRKIRQITALMRSLASKLPSKCLFDLSSKAKTRLLYRADSSKPDLIICNGIETYPLIRELRSEADTALVAHNVETAIYAEQTRRLRRLPIVGTLFRHDLDKISRVERNALNDASHVVALSQTDAAAIESITGGKKPLVLHTTFAYPPYIRRPGTDRQRPLRLAFLARYSWWPNTEAVEWLANNVLPKLPPETVRVDLYGPGAERFRRRHPLLCIKGPVPDLQLVWSQCDIFICPMISGSGINIKFLEALYNRQPVLATSFTQRGLAPIVDPAVRFIDEPDGWADFLQSAAAEELARSSPTAETANRFTRASAAQALATFLHRTGSKPGR